MSGLPSGVSVLRHVPQHLLDGYASGEFRLWGGVLRRASGAGQGQIVGFLTEGWELARHVEQNLPINAEALRVAVGNVEMASQLAAGMGVLNLGVQVAGFAMVMRRLDRIAGQIEAARGELRAVGQNVEWLTLMRIAGLRAEAENAVATAERAVRQGDRNLLNQAKTMGSGVRRHLVNIGGEMLVTGRAVPQRALFEEFVKLSVLVAYAEARCDEAVEGAGQAAHDLKATAAAIRHLSNGYRYQVRKFAQNPLELLKIGDAGRDATKTLALRLDAIVGRLEGYVPQLELQHALGLDAAGWRALVAPEGSGALTCIAAEETRTGDLLELVLANTASASQG